MNLTIDRGNSSTKLTVWDGSRPVDAVTVADLTAAELCRFAGGKRFDGVILSAVAPVAAEAEEAARTLGRRYVRLSADTPTPLDFSLYASEPTASRPPSERVRLSTEGRCLSATSERLRHSTSSTPAIVFAEVSYRRG